VRNVPVLSPAVDLSRPDIASEDVRREVAAALTRFDLAAGDVPVAVSLRWGGSATWQRLDAVAGGIAAGLAPVLERGHPLIAVWDNDIGGLVGIHLKEEMHLPNPVISIDRVELKEFDYIDVGAIIHSTGAVPVIVKSLVFPGAEEPRNQGTEEQEP
jgi:ethanolamine utilization protein EutA